MVAVFSFVGDCAPSEALPSWTRAQQTREFIAALEKLWAQEGYDLSPGAAKGQRIIWMKQQADRLDPMLPSPSSVLDRKGELGPHWQ
jgi:hypothetical protein